MNRFFRKWLAVVVVLVWSGGIPVSVPAQDADKIDLAEITRRLKEWRSSFVNLHAVWEVRSLPTTTEQPLTEWDPPDDPAAGKLFLRKEWVWADHGLDYYASLGKKDPWSVEVFNGPKGVVFRANYKQMPEGSPVLGQLILRGVNSGKPKSSLGRVPLDGLYWPGSATWLPELLSEWKWTVETIEDVGKHRCAKIVAKDPWFTDLDWVHFLWIDLKHDCLVRRHLGPRIPEKRTGRDFLVEEFQRLENGIWFPKRGRFQMEDSPYANHSWEVTEVALNQTLDLSRFEPPQPVVGTLVDNDKGNVYTYKGAGQESGSKALPLAGSMPGKSSLHSATPPASGWLWWSGGLLFASLVFLVVGFFFWRRT